MSTVCDQQARPPITETPSISRRNERKRGKLTGRVSRHFVTRGVFAIPVLPNGSPDRASASEGYTVDVGADGVTFEIIARPLSETANWVVGIEKPDGELGYLSVRSHGITPDGIGSRIDAEFLEAARDPLGVGNLMPTLDSETFAFRPKLSREALQQWQALGVVRPKVVDCVIVCPRCHSLPTMRRGCRACGSIEVDSDQFIHHFACAHVDLVEQFQFEDEVGCPKCLASKLIVGADFEFLRGPYSCQDCGWSDKDLENIGRCMACGFEFPQHQAVEQEVIGYHVDRLEPLDLLPAY
jgi:hypothetical protein